MTPSFRRPTVSVCIANYNGMAVIDACLRSVLPHDAGLEVEIIVHDDASTDGSAEHIERHYPGVILIKSDRNVGFCIANNRMAAKANGKYLLLLNNDAELFSDALQILYEAAVGLGKPAILGLPQYSASSGELIDIGSTFDIFLNPIPNLDNDPKDVGMIIGACLWLPKSLWIELGGFPEWFGSLAEDMYLCCVARLFNYPVIALKKSGFRHWVGASLGGGKIVGGRLVTRKKRRALSERNKSFVMALTFPAPLFYILFPLHVVMLAIEGLMLASIKMDWRLFKQIYAYAIAELWRNRSRLRSLRHELQARRRSSPKDFFSVFSPIPHKLRMLLRHGMPKLI